MSRQSSALSSAKYAMPPEFGGKYTTECLDAKFPGSLWPTLLNPVIFVNMSYNFRYLYAKVINLTSEILDYVCIQFEVDLLSVWL